MNLKNVFTGGFIVLGVIAPTNRAFSQNPGDAVALANQVGTQVSASPSMLSQYCHDSGNPAALSELQQWNQKASSQLVSAQQDLYHASWEHLKSSTSRVVENTGAAVVSGYLLGKGTALYDQFFRHAVESVYLGGDPASAWTSVFDRTLELAGNGELSEASTLAKRALSDSDELGLLSLVPAAVIVLKSRYANSLANEAVDDQSKTMDGKIGQFEDKFSQVYPAPSYQAGADQWVREANALETEVNSFDKDAKTATGRKLTDSGAIQSHWYSLGDASDLNTEIDQTSVEERVNFYRAAYQTSKQMLDAFGSVCSAQMDPAVSVRTQKPGSQEVASSTQKDSNITATTSHTAN